MTATHHQLACNAIHGAAASRLHHRIRKGRLTVTLPLPFTCCAISGVVVTLEAITSMLLKSLAGTCPTTTSQRTVVGSTVDQKVQCASGAQMTTLTDTTSQAMHQAALSAFRLVTYTSISYSLLQFHPHLQTISCCIASHISHTHYYSVLLLLDPCNNSTQQRTTLHPLPLITSCQTLASRSSGLSTLVRSLTAQAR
jgi:hypothetical protein